MESIQHKYIKEKQQLSRNIYIYLYVGGLICFASTVIFLFTLDISG